MPVLVEHDKVPVSGVGLALAIEYRADIAYFQAAPESYVHPVAEGVVSPPGRRQRMRIEEVIGNHKGAFTVHKSGRALQKAGGTVGKLGPQHSGGQHQHKQNKQTALHIRLDYQLE